MLFRTPFFLPWLYPSLIWRVNTSERKIFLTFDDGPVPGPTEFVLETLKKYNAKATFFCIGDNVRKHPMVFKKVVADGHAIGNHTFHHMPGWENSATDYLNDTQKCEAQLEEAGYKSGLTGKPYFRPPYGKIKRAQIRALSNYNIVMWDVLTQDYDKSLLPETCLNKSIKATRAGSIVVFHDSVKAMPTLEYVLPRYLEYFNKQGYLFESFQ
jgi:peptidoglycan-N-acetylglucosamine deacetylase